jgi:hypothetical protein
MDDWLTFAIDAVGGASAFICLFEGTRRLAAHGRSAKATVMVLLGALYCVCYSGYFLWRHQELRTYAETLYQQSSKGELPADWGKELPGPRREASSHSLARAAYVESGTLRSYFDAQGARKPFAPVQADVKRRDVVVAAQTRTAQDVRASFSSGILWLTWGVIAVLFGLGVARDRGVRPPPPPPQGV